MNEKQLNEFMKTLASDYAKMSKKHVELIQDHIAGEFLDSDFFYRQDIKYNAMLETQKHIIDTFLKIKNQA